MLPALGALVDQSLVLRVPSPDDQPRFRLLEPVRQFAMQRLHASGRATATADLHAAHFHARATASAALIEGHDLVPTIDRLEADHANLRSAYLRLLELDRDGDAAELAGSVWLYLALRGHAREGLAWLERIGPGVSDVARCRALTGRLGLLLLTGDNVAMRREADVAVALCGRVADPAVTCETLTLAGQSALYTGELDIAEAWLATAAAQAQDAGRPWVGVHARLAQGQLALVAGDLATAGEVLPEVVSASRNRGNPFTLATALNVHATLTELLGDEPATAALLGEARRTVARRPAELDPRLRAARAGERWRCGWATRHPRRGCSGRAPRSRRRMPSTRPSRCRGRCPTAGSTPPGPPSRAGVHSRVGLPAVPRATPRSRPGPRRS